MTVNQDSARWNVADWHGKMLVDRNGEKLGKFHDRVVVAEAGDVERECRRGEDPQHDRDDAADPDGRVHRPAREEDLRAQLPTVPGADRRVHSLTKAQRARSRANHHRP